MGQIIHLLRAQREISKTILAMLKQFDLYVQNKTKLFGRSQCIKGRKDVPFFDLLH